MSLNVLQQDKCFNIILNKQATSFHFVWLRDNCQCSQCFFPTSHQKKHSCAAIPLDIKPKSFNVEGDYLSVVWSDGHVSKYTKDWLLKYTYTKDSLKERRTALKPSLWSSKDINGDHNSDYESFMHNDAALMRTLKIFLDYGIIFITGVPAPSPTDTMTPIEKVIARIGPLRETFYGRVFDVINYADPSNMAYTASKLELHQDLVYYESVPPVQLLHCIVQSKLGGENVFVDSYQAAENLRRTKKQHFDTLMRVPVTFIRNNNGHNFNCQKHILYQNENLYIGVNYSPHNHGPLLAPPHEVEAWYDAFSEFSKSIYTDDLMLIKKLAPGELVMFDNRRVLHGRASYNPGEARHLQGAYLGMDEVYDRHNVLKWQSERVSSP